ncbi:TPA: exosome complex protein Rrp42 [Candidatus Micrarchaeota archaeon]|nr:exosome complex protein Rrp42 [Candidatus Micrarchaeota archaeon]
MTVILKEVTEAVVKDLMKNGKREDNRPFTEYRNAIVQKGMLQNTEGSALAQLGDTKVLCGIKFDLLAPFADRPDEAVVMVGSEFSPMANPEFQAGPPGEDSIELARVVDRAIRSAGCIDTKTLPRSKDKVMGIFIDLHILDHCGNLIDTAALAAMAALRNAKMPKLEIEGETGKLVRDEFTGPLPLTRSAITCSFEKIGGKILVDATDAEEVASDGRLTIGVTDDGFICCGQKSKAAGFQREEMMQLTDLAFEKSKALFELI